MDEVEHLRHTDVNRARQETIERVFADAKEKHGMRWTRYCGVKKTTLQAMLTFIALNLKKPANWSWDSYGNPRVFNILVINIYNKPTFRSLNEGLSTI